MDDTLTLKMLEEVIRAFPTQEKQVIIPDSKDPNTFYVCDLDSMRYPNRAKGSLKNKRKKTRGFR